MTKSLIVAALLSSIAVASFADATPGNTPAAAASAPAQHPIKKVKKAIKAHKAKKAASAAEAASK